ncbi:MAG: transcriptional regulator [Halobacteriales archaeon]
MTDNITNVAVLGTGGIGKRTLRVMEHKDELTPVAVCDSGGVAVDFDGVDYDALVAADGGAVAARDGSEVAALPDGRTTDDSVGDVIDVHEGIDAVLMALPNIPHSFIPETVDRFVEAGYEGVMVDVLKRSRVIDEMEEREDDLKEAGVTFVCGAGATPGFLTGAASVAAQSFVEIEEVEIWWGVGLKSGYEGNVGTVREDIAHLDGYDLETVSEMSDDEIREVIDEHDGVLEFHDMEHADDRLLERAGVCDADKVKVGGILDVTQDEKPTTTTVRVTGTTFDGETATNTFQLDDDTSMAANVNGPALGYLRAGVFYNENGVYGLQGPAEMMPRF